MSTMTMLAPFAKVNKTEDGGREVWGFATLERVDKSGEIADFEGTLNAFKEWSSEIEKNTQGKSKGNIRVMHQPVTGGTVLDWQPGETKIEENGKEEAVKGIWVGSYIPPHKTDVIADIDSGILSAYSIGGQYAKRWFDNTQGAFRFIPKMGELSLVDNPCVPGAEFQMVKAESGPWDNKQKVGEAMSEELEKMSPDGTYEAIQEKLNSAINDGWHDRYILLTYPDKIVVRDWSADCYFEVPYSIDENGCVKLGDPKQVEQTFVPVEAQKMVKAAKEERDKLKVDAEERASKYGIAFKEGKGHLTPPKGKPTAPEDYGDPTNYAYPIDSSHIKAAVSYFNQDGEREAGDYSEEEWATIGKRISEAASHLEGGEYKYEDGKIVTPTESDKGSDKSVDAEQLAKAALAAGISIEQMTKLFAELAKAEKPTMEKPVDGDGDDDKNKEFPAKDKDAVPPGKAEADAKENEDGISKDDGDVEEMAKTVSELMSSLDLTKAGASISEANREKLHKAAAHIHDTCSCDKCNKAASIFAGKEGTNNGEEPQEPPVKKEFMADLQKEVGSSFAKFQSEVSEVAKAVASVTSTLDTLNKSVEAVDKRVEDFAKTADERLKAIEETPAAGGPLLFGATGEGVDLSKSAPAVSEYELLNKAFDATTDATTKDILGRRIALLERKNQR